MDKNIKQDKGLRARLTARLRAGVRDDRGAAAVFFAVGLLLLAPATLGLVDIYLTSTQRGQLQDAVDAAALYAARSEETTTEGIDRVGDAALLANLKLPPGQRVTLSEFKLDGVKITGLVKISPPSIGPAFWTKADIEAESEVVRNSNNVEVAIVLDTTGSMSGEMENLKTAATELVNLVVKDAQTPFYSKAALIPYSVGVNAGDYADKARGAITPKMNVTKIERKDSKVQFTVAAHGFTTGDHVYLPVRVPGIKVADNRIAAGDYAITKVTNDTFTLDGVNGAVTGTYVSGDAEMYCTKPGCKYYRFQNAKSGTQYSTLPVSTCATERTGTHAYDDTAPGTAFVGRHYSNSEASNMGCKSGSIIPLTATKSKLTDQITTLKSDGSTAGQIGLGWGWYMVSPEWASLWPDNESKPAAYDAPNTVKVVVLMTDGAFNTNYCNGVSSNDSFGDSGDRAKCNATNGGAFTQAATLCKNMKDKKIVVYTVGFNVGNDKTVKDFLKTCATDTDHYYLPSSGTALKDAFKAIGQDINSLRIAK